MSTNDRTSDTSRAPQLLRGGAVAFGLMGLLIGGWVVAQWILHPEIQAEQAGNTAPYWPGLFFTVAACTAGAVTIFLTAARRTEDGENLYANRHRKRPGEEE